MIRLVKIKFRPAGRHYDFNAQSYELQTEQRVVVETDRGRALGTVVYPPREVARSSAPEDLKSILRPANDEDVALAAANTAREGESFRFCRQRIQERKMEMKLVRAEYLFDGSKIIFYFTADGRIDFRELVKDLAHHFHTRIEMRQIGVRDEAKLCGGLGICGRELCCSTFLTEFAPVSVKMAKEQGLALNPTKISGQCGRLLCCLAYEFETYSAMKKALPKCGRKVTLDGREGEVVEIHILAQNAVVRFEDGARAKVSPEQLDQGTLGPQAVTTPAPTGRSGAPRREGGNESGRGRNERPQSQRSGQQQRQGEGQRPAASPSAAPQPAKPAPPAPSQQNKAEASAPQTNEQEGKRKRRNRRRGKRKGTPNQPSGAPTGE
jgi:cell fate regulator YaaT (PSP1 superfamily)